MKPIQILKNNSVITDKCFEANYLGRLKGLLGVKKLEEGGGLLLPGTNSVHMWGMSISLDIVFIRRLDRTGKRFRITSIYPGVKPWKILPLWDLGSTDVLEFSVGFIRQTNLGVGDEIHVSTKGALSAEK